jgi:hypothetical protein
MSEPIGRPILAAKSLAAESVGFVELNPPHATDG